MKCLAKRKGFYGGCLIRPGGFFEATECPDWATPLEVDGGGDGGESVGEKISIRDALLTLRRDDESQWNKNGSPKVDVVSDICGYKVKKADVDESWPGFTRDMLKHGQKLDDGSILGV